MRAVFLVLIVLTGLGVYSGYEIVSRLRMHADHSLFSHLESLPFASQ